MLIIKVGSETQTLKNHHPGLFIYNKEGARNGPVSQPRCLFIPESIFTNCFVLPAIGKLYYRFSLSLGFPIANSGLCGPGDKNKKPQVSVRLKTGSKTHKNSPCPKCFLLSSSKKSFFRHIPRSKIQSQLEPAAPRSG